ncbi:hypothetical protein FRC0191_00732 [Corynebacterium diphtheriae]|uniref:Uncharacterized protein n=1 Tax=Corynebacterium diphtheriae bv. mitis TaxID=1806053 RepID=A0A854NIL7_CORDP|nr:hypothetical protein AY602_00845 [Corynebacterium diphtheriae bv. mitis]OWM44833.1 hypothetical protein BU160_10405 [Corynebacterium diphtheriae]OWN97467.1 hypothetical protein AY526_08920 [Corynebacterium diphtheriae bv. gravis]OWO34476.1 hypothetical protein AY540_00435 [Corynebacterium diphtheriae bv. gravis]CAB0497521.1 hypothetical protein CIP103987_00608 [Corynebacterium diphtheriae]
MNGEHTLTLMGDRQGEGPKLKSVIRFQGGLLPCKSPRITFVVTWQERFPFMGGVSYVVLGDGSAVSWLT